MIEKKEKNIKIAIQRILVENFFGRLKVIWSTFLRGYRGHLDHLDQRFEVAVHFTNIHIQYHPLRRDKKEIEEDGNEIILE